MTFAEPTLWTGSANPFLVTEESTDAAIPGAWTCKNASATTVGCNADNADVTTATFQPTVPLKAGRMYIVRADGGIYDLLGNGPTYIWDEFKAT